MSQFDPNLKKEEIGNYRIVTQLGQGGMGTVYLAQLKGTRKKVALKTLRYPSSKMLLRFKNEFRELANIRHPNLVELYELHAEENVWFFTMEYIQGVDFFSYVQNAPLFDPARFNRKDLSTAGLDNLSSSQNGETMDSGARSETSGTTIYEVYKLREALKQLCAGIHALHQAGKVHRDLKPANVLVSTDGRVVILDFGLIKDLSSSGDQSTDLGIKGTPIYMSPEQANDQPLTHATDWYSVGVMLYECLTGSVPFEGKDVSVLMKKLQRDPEPVLQLNPSADPMLADLCMSLLRRMPNQRPRGKDILRFLGIDEQTVIGQTAVSDSTITGSKVFIGREREFKMLFNTFESSIQQPLSLVVVQGISGIGKSALVNHFLDEMCGLDQSPSLGGANPLVLRGRCYERESVPFKAFDALVDALCHFLTKLSESSLQKILPAEIAFTVELFPVLKRIPLIDSDDFRRTMIPDPYEMRKRAFAAFQLLLRNISLELPLVLFIDDLQWADNDSLELLNALIAPTNRPKGLLLATIRLEDTKSIISEEDLNTLLKKASGKTITLQSLSQNETIEMIKKLVGSPKKYEELKKIAHKIYKESLGNPFFVSELVRYSQLKLELAEHLELLETVTLEQVVEERVKMLSERGLKMLHLIAVSGKPITQELLAKAAHLSLKDLDWTADLSALKVARFIRLHGFHLSDTVEPYHDQIRQAIIQSINVEQLRGYHRQLALAHESTSPPRIDLLARHWLAAGHEQRAKDYLEKAAAQAMAQFAFEYAITLYRQLLELPLNASKRSEVYLRLGDCLANTGRPGLAAEAYKDSLPDAPDKSVALKARYAATQQLLRGGYITEGLEEVKQVLSEMGMRLALTANMALVSIIAQRIFFAFRGLRFKERDSSEISSKDMTTIEVLWSVAHSLQMVDTIHGADFHLRFLRFTLRKGDIPHVVGALLSHAAFYATSGGSQFDKAYKLVYKAEALARKIDDIKLIASAKGIRGMIDYWSGKWSNAYTLMEEAESIFRNRCYNVSWELAMARFFLCLSLIQRGYYSELREKFQHFYNDAVRVGDNYAAANLVTRLNSVFLAADDIDSASTHLQKILSTWPENAYHVQHLYHLFARTELLLYSQQIDEAYSEVEKDYPKLKRSLLLRVQIFRVEYLRLAARVYLAKMVKETVPSQRNLLLAKVKNIIKKLRKEALPFTKPWADMLQAALYAIKNNHEESLQTLIDCIGALEAVEAYANAAAVRRVKGIMMGGDEGHKEIARADLWMRTNGIKNPEKFTFLLLPGFSLSR